MSEIWGNGEVGYGIGESRGQPMSLQLCLGHQGMIGLSGNAYERCAVHNVDSTNDDEDLEKPITPIAYLPHSCNEWLIGGRNELLQLRDDIDEALERLP